MNGNITGRRADAAVGWAAVGFAGAGFANLVLTDVPDLGDSTAATRAFYAVPAHRLQAVIAVYVLAAAMACFLVLLAGLVGRLRGSPPGRTAAEVTLVAGAAYATLTLAAGVAFAAPAAGVVLHLGGGTVVDPGFARAASALGVALLLLGAPLAAAVFLAAACVGSRRAGVLPRWITTSGLVVAVVLLAGATWFPLLLLLAWALALGVSDLAPSSRADGALAVGGASR